MTALASIDPCLTDMVKDTLGWWGKAALALNVDGSRTCRCLFGRLWGEVLVRRVSRVLCIAGAAPIAAKPLKGPTYSAHHSSCFSSRLPRNDMMNVPMLWPAERFSIPFIYLQRFHFERLQQGVYFLPCME